MGRKYKGLDYGKVTVKLSEDEFNIVGRYCREHCLWTTARRSETIRDAIKLLGAYMELSDVTETSCANLLDIANEFDKIKGKTTPMYAEAIREAAALLAVFCPTLSILEYEKQANDEVKCEDIPCLRHSTRR